MEFNLAQLEEITGITFKTLKKKLATVAPTRVEGKGKFYSSKEVLPLLYSTKDEDTLDLTRERARLARAQAEKTEYELGKMKKNLLPSEEIEDLWIRYITNTRGKLLLLPKKISKKLKGLNDLKKIESVLEENVYASLEELAKGDSSNES